MTRMYMHMWAQCRNFLAWHIVSSVTSATAALSNALMFNVVCFSVNNSTHERRPKCRNVPRTLSERHKDGNPSVPSGE